MPGMVTDRCSARARSAAAVPDSSYAYKPTPAVRSFGQLIAHVAGAQRMYCAAALGEPMPPVRLAGFALVWLALVVLSVDGLRAGARSRADARRLAAQAAAHPTTPG